MGEGANGNAVVDMWDWSDEHVSADEQVSVLLVGNGIAVVLDSDGDYSNVPYTILV